MIPTEIYPLLGAPLGALVGGLIGFFSARAQWSTQTRLHRQNLAKGFLLEIRQLKVTLQLFTSMFEKTPGAYAIEMPLYGRDGLYYVALKEIASFNTPLAESLYRFYMHMLEAERARQTPKDSQFYQISLNAVRAAIVDANRLLASLEPMLEKESA